MHSRVVVLDENADLDLDSVFEEMQSYGNGVDYIVESEDDFDADYEWFMDYVTDLGFKRKAYKSEIVNGLVIERGFEIAKESWFWSEMKNDIEKILEEDGMRLGRFRIEDRVGMKRTFWLYYEGQLWTLPYFMEYGKGEKKEFKIYKFLDYHY